MKKMMYLLKTKCSMVNLANVLALALMVYSVNVACVWAHHQPEVPDGARRFRRF